MNSTPIPGTISEHRSACACVSENELERAYGRQLVTVCCDGGAHKSCLVNDPVVQTVKNAHKTRHKRVRAAHVTHGVAHRQWATAICVHSPHPPLHTPAYYTHKKNRRKLAEPLNIVSTNSLTFFPFLPLSTSLPVKNRVRSFETEVRFGSLIHRFRRLAAIHYTSPNQSQ